MNKMKLTIDRIEGEYAVVINDSGEKFDIPTGVFPGLKEGNVYELRIDENETESRRERIEKLMDDVWE